MPVSILVSNDDLINNDIKQKIAFSCNRTNKLCSKEENKNNFFATVSYTENCILGKNRIYTDDEVIAIFGGIFVDGSTIPWEKIIYALKSEAYQFFTEFNAPFMVAAYFKKSKKTFWVSDRFSQFPSYYYIKNNKVLLSSSLSTFFDCLDEKKFNEKWLYDYVLFNLPIDTITPIEDVFRMPAASVFCFQDNFLKKTCYSSRFHAHIPIQSDKKSQVQAYALFKERFPKYYSILSKGKYASAITSGYDSRLAALFAPDDIDFNLYTYGMPSCEDIVTGKAIADALKVEHHALCLTPDILKNLNLMADKSTLSTGGTLNILRSTLQWVYEQLANLKIEAVTGGIAGDHFFRSDGTPGNNLSICSSELFTSPNYDVTTNPYFSVFESAADAKEYFNISRDSFEKRFDWSKTELGERHLNFAMYELSTKYYGAEHELAEHYVNLSSPYWDVKVREFAYNTTISTLTTNQNLHNGIYPYWKANSVFAYILYQHPVFKKLNVYGTTPFFNQFGSKNAILFGKILHKSIPYVINKFFPANEDPQENWPEWFSTYLLKPMQGKVTPLCIEKYINKNILHKILACNKNAFPNATELFIGGKILTIEHILRKF